jgi:hypothetical protein
VSLKLNKTRKIKPQVSYLAFLFSTYSVLTFARPPAPVIAQMETLARVEAAIGICTSSSEFKKIDPNRALQFFDVSFKIEDLIVEIEKRYNDKDAYAAYKYASIKIGESVEFRQAFSNTYRSPCMEKMRVDSLREIDTVRVQLRAIIGGRQ